MLKQKYFLTDFFILSAEKQPIKSSWRKIEWLPLQNKLSEVIGKLNSIYMIQTLNFMKNILYGYACYCLLFCC